jgi:hypothetical protein
MSFEEWLDESFCKRDMPTSTVMMEIAWKHQQQKINTLQKENDMLKEALREIINVEGDSQVSCFAQYTLDKLKED